MALLEKWRRGREMERFRDEFDDLMERFGLDRDWFGRFPFNREWLTDWEARPPKLAIESRVENDELIVRTDLPGIDPKDVDIKVVGNMLTLKGERGEKKETKKSDYLHREIRYGSFERSIALPEGIKGDDLKATYKDGVLELTAPMPKEAIPKEVKIQVEAKGSEQKKAQVRSVEARMIASDCSSCVLDERI